MIQYYVKAMIYEQMLRSMQEESTSFPHVLFNEFIAMCDDFGPEWKELKDKHGCNRWTHSGPVR